MTDLPAAPDSSAVRTALWRALHVELDAPPHVFTDLVGLQLAEPEANWRQRPDMNPAFTRSFWASIVARARFVEDLVQRTPARGWGSTCSWALAWTASPSAGRTWGPG
jgi:hypothetical protein